MPSKVASADMVSPGKREKGNLANPRGALLRRPQKGPPGLTSGTIDVGVNAAAAETASTAAVRRILCAIELGGCEGSKIRQEGALLHPLAAKNKKTLCNSS